MKIRHIQIDNFRGIKHLGWHVGGDTICLIGPGDSTKSTILDAIEYALSPRWNIPFFDHDFYLGDTSKPIDIQVCLGSLSPSQLSAEDAYGCFLMGYLDTGILPEPEDGSEAVIVVRLVVAEDLEPNWEVMKPDAEGKRLSVRDREKFGVSRLGHDLEKHLTWSRGSALARLTNDPRSVPSILTAIGRAASDAIQSHKDTSLSATTTKAVEVAAEFGASHKSMSVGLDMRNQYIGSGAVALHDENKVPLRMHGLGTKRLTSLAIQHSTGVDTPLILIDEIEHGLEPHRIRQLIRRLVSSNTGQVFFSTHSPTSIVELDIPHLRFVRCTDGITVVLKGDPSLQSTVRKYPLSFLAPRIVVCEGKTEEGMFRAFDEYWSASKVSCATAGVVPVEATGCSNAPKVALDFKSLGYDVLYFGDSDQPLGVSEEELAANGVCVCLWKDTKATEERVALDLPIAGLQEFLEAAIVNRGHHTVRDDLRSLPAGAHIDSLTLTEWSLIEINDATTRELIGKAAKARGWFKNIDGGIQLGTLVTKYILGCSDKPLKETIDEIERWVYGL